MKKILLSVAALAAAWINAAAARADVNIGLTADETAALWWAHLDEVTNTPAWMVRWERKVKDPVYEAENVPHDMKIFLLVGQSNMAGRGPLTAADQKPIDRCLMLDRNGKWVKASPPIHADRQTSGIGIADSFVRCYLAEHPGVTVGLVPCAVGGSNSATWSPEPEKGPVGKNYHWTVARAKLALKNGTLAGILWHQGESDEGRCKTFGSEYYVARLAAMATAFRRDLDSPEAPFLIGEIGTLPKGHAKVMNPVLKSAADRIPGAALVKAADLTGHLPDGVHFDTPAYRTLGERYYREWKRLSKVQVKVETRRGRRSLGEETVFHVSLVDGSGTLRRSGSGLVVVDNFGPNVQASNQVDFVAAQPFTVKGTLKEPGYLRVTVDVKGVSRDPDDKPQMYSVPYAPEKIVQGAPEPADFDAFWQRETAELDATTPVDPTMVKVPEKSNERWTVYKVSFASKGRRAWGWLSIPCGKGPWPVEVGVASAGCGGYSMLPQTAPDRIRLYMTVFPFEPSLDMKENTRRFDALNAACKAKYGVPRYPFAGMDASREEYFFLPVALGNARAVKWLAARPEVDRGNFRYVGGSQGGGSGLYLLGLTKGIFTFATIMVPAMTDTLGWMKGRAGGWPHCDFEWFTDDDRARDERVKQVMPYFDGCNFAARVDCPVRVIAGGSDWVCPPSAVTAAYNRIPAKGKRLIFVPGGTHWSAPGIGCREDDAERKAYTAKRAETVSRPVALGGLIDPEDSDYVQRKFREEVCDAATGLARDELGEPAKAVAIAALESGDTWQVAKAKAFAFLCREMRVDASEHDLFPALSCWSRWPRPMQKATNWRDHQINETHLKKECAAVKAGWNSGRFSMWKDFDHSVPPWDELLAGGWPMMEARLGKYEKNTPYYRALRITIDACFAALKRFEDAARRAAAAASTPERRKLLEREAEALAQLRRGAPRTAYEALMFQWTYFFLSEHVDALQVRSLGPLDVLLTPFYRADLAAGRTTPEAFKRDLAYFWWQWGSVDNYWGQPVALGGTKADGTTEYNEVSDLILDVHDALALPTPKMLVKIATNTPDRVLDRMLGMAARHRSMTFDGEEGLKRSLQSWIHCTDEECRTCDLNGCYEFYTHGTMNVTQSSHISFLQPLHDVLMRYTHRDGRDGDGAPSLPATFDEFKAAYFEELRKNTFECMELTDAWEKYLGEISPGNVYSLAIESAVRGQKDAFYNGLKYNETALLSVGLGTAVDALMAVKELVYEHGRDGTPSPSAVGGGAPTLPNGVSSATGVMGLAELGKIMAANWKGHEELRQRMLRSKRKWGNNDPEANAMGKEIVAHMSQWVNGRPNARGGVWGFSGHPARQFIVLMAHTGATPDGRRAGEESSKNLSPTQGMDTEGVTALINTLSNLRPEDLPVNFPLDVMLHPSVVGDARGLAAMRALARVYFANGGQTLQFNVFNLEELRAARKEPWKYENLQVRVCGWNVRWNDLSKEEQDKYILRAALIQD